VTAPLLRAPGLVLRPLSTEDAEDLHKAHRDPAVHEYWSSPAHADIEQTRRYIAETLALPGAHVWAITENGGDALGRVALFAVREGVGEIGVILSAEAQGQGFAARALRLVETYAFEVLDLHRLSADVDPDNAASLALFDRLGYQREGLLRGNWKTHIGVRDSVIFGKLRGVL